MIYIYETMVRELLRSAKLNASQNVLYTKNHIHQTMEKQKVIHNDRHLIIHFIFDVFITIRHKINFIFD